MIVFFCLVPFAGSICNRDVITEMETDGDIVDVDTDFMDPQQCATIACDIYKHLRASEVIIFFFYIFKYNLKTYFELLVLKFVPLCNVNGSGKEKAFNRFHGENSEGYKFKYACHTDRLACGGNFSFLTLLVFKVISFFNV